MKGTGSQSVRLYQKATILGHRRSLKNPHPNITLISIDGVKSPAESEYYLGKRVAYVYRAKTQRAVRHAHNGNQDKTNHRVIWGKVVRKHGNSGVVRAKFASNIPPKAFGARARVMLFPSNV